MSNANNPNVTEQDLFIKMVLSAWDVHIKRINKLIETLSDDQWMTATAPGRNRGIYLLGHLTAVHDGMIPLLGFGENMYPDMFTVFVSSPDNPEQEMPSLAELKKRWQEVSSRLSGYFEKETAKGWLEKHTAVSAEDFAKEPHRNKLNVVINRTNHLAYHWGQLVYLEPKKTD